MKTWGQNSLLAECQKTHYFPLDFRAANKGRKGERVESTALDQVNDV